MTGNCTPKSILDNFLGLLKQNGEAQHLESIFNTAYEDSSDERCKLQYTPRLTPQLGMTDILRFRTRRVCESISNTHIQLIKPNTTLPLPWQRFRFHAFLPLSLGYSEGKIDYEAFQRTTLLLAARGTDLLDTVVNGDIPWRDEDRDYIWKARFERILRSIAVPLEKKFGRSHNID